MKTSQAGIALIRTFEGCRLTAYTCPAGVLTIGVGHTGPDVKPGMTITQAQADALLAQDLVRFEQAVDRLIEPTQNQAQFDAITSFCFNCGEGALTESTLRRRMNAGEDLNKVAREELPKWVKGANGEPLAGLVRRRDAEVELHCSGGSAPAAPAPSGREVTVTASRETVLKKKPLPSSELADNEKSAQPAGKVYTSAHALKAENGHTLLELPFGGGQWWAFDSHWSGLSAAPAAAQPSGNNPIPVKYQSQNDNASGTGYRECFSSSCAMVAMFYGKVANDDEYNRIRAKYGDSTDSGAQVKALQSLGLNAAFKTTCTVAWLKAQIDKGRPTPCGWLHHGPASAPTGGGHWTVVIGFTETVTIHNDPNGEADLVAGGYTSNTNGAGQHYSWKNWQPRWCPEGDGSGWAMDIHP